MEKKQNINLASKFFTNKRRSFIIFLVLFVLVSYISKELIDFKFLVIFTKFNQAFTRFVSLYLPPAFKNFNELLIALWDTFILSVSAGVIGSALAYIAALIISKKTTFSRILGIIVRFLSNFVRNVPSTVWAMILLLSFWFGDFLALVVLALGSFGFNARVFADTFDEVSPDMLEAMDAVGATRFQKIAQAIYPETFPTILSWTLYAIETNIRDATIVGMLAGGGIGYLLGIFRNFRRFDELTAAVILIVILVISFDRLSDYIRRKLAI